MSANHVAPGAHPVNDEQTAEFIEDVADVLEREGWVKGTAKGYSTGTSTEDLKGYCMLGGIDRTWTLSNGRWYGTDMVGAVMEAIGSRLPTAMISPGDFQGSIIRFNDGPSTKQQVLDKLREISKELRTHE